MSLSLGNLILMFLMFSASGFGFFMRPTQKIADVGPKINLEALIPKQFADWKVDDKVVPLQIDPQRLEALNKIYNQTLSRAYVNSNGERIMLSIAYGGDQSDSMQVHRPEVCYPAQGFQVLKLATGMFNTGFSEIPVKRMVAIQGPRVEPIIYWITIGDTVAINSLEWKLTQLKYGLTGKVPDGMLFRVSSLGEEETAYPVQEEFIRDLLKSLSPESRKRLAGSTTL